MCNLSITTENYNTETTSSPDGNQGESHSKQTFPPTFKPYNNQQIQVIFDLQELIPDHHVARVIDEMVEAIPDQRLFSYYPGGGRSSYHPKMMLKVILYGYSQKVYSCRGIEKLIQESIPAMWLAAMQSPDFRTLNEFRGVRMKVLMDELFEAMIQKLIEENYITFENYFLDGTKIEADANKYSFVWKKSITKFEEKLKEKIQETLRHIEEMTQMEADTKADHILENPEEVPEKLKEVATELEAKVETLNEEIHEEENTNVRKEIRKRRRTLQKPLKLIRDSVFGHIKGNRSFRRFSLRGLEKVHVEFGLVALAHNLLKVAGLRLDAFKEKTKTRPSRTKNSTWPCFILGTYQTAPFL